MPSFKSDTILKNILPKTSAPKSSYSPSYSPTFPAVPAPTISGEQTIPDYLIPSGFNRGQLSPYFGKINISASYAYNYINPSEIKLSSSLSNNEKVNITGWRIKTNYGEIIIPQAINVYDPSWLSLQEDIILSTNNYVNIYLSINPINKNFRLNKCMGYLQNDYIFFLHCHRTVHRLLVQKFLIFRVNANPIFFLYGDAKFRTKIPALFIFR